MLRQWIVQPKVIVAILFLQLIPLVLFPLEAFSATTQEWWLPVILAVLALVGVIQLLRRAVVLWPWHLVGFAQGFNIISRLMMLMPHATRGQGADQMLNGPYLLLTTLAIILSLFLLWYTELPEVRMGLLQK